MEPVGCCRLIARYFLRFLITVIAFGQAVIRVDGNDDSGKPPWELKCEHITDVLSYHRVVIIWTLNNNIWLQIDKGKIILSPKLTSLKKVENLEETDNSDYYPDDNVRQANVYEILINDGRYTFNYDENKGDFSLSIKNGKIDDKGQWECIVELYDQPETIEPTLIKSYQWFTDEHVTDDDRTTWAYWNLNTNAPYREIGEANVDHTDKDSDNDNNVVVDDSDKKFDKLFSNDTLFNNTAIATKWTRFHPYVVPMLLVLPTVMVIH